MVAGEKGHLADARVMPVVEATEPSVEAPGHPNLGSTDSEEYSALQCLPTHALPTWQVLHLRPGVFPCLLPWTSIGLDPKEGTRFNHSGVGPSPFHCSTRLTHLGLHPTATCRQEDDGDLESKQQCHFKCSSS